MIKDNKLIHIGKAFLTVLSVNIITLISCILGSLIYQNVHITNFADMLSSTMNSDFGYVLCMIITTIFVCLFYKYIMKKEKITGEIWDFLPSIFYQKLSQGFH